MIYDGLERDNRWETPSIRNLITPSQQVQYPGAKNGQMPMAMPCEPKIVEFSHIDIYGHGERWDAARLTIVLA